MDRLSLDPRVFRILAGAGKPFARSVDIQAASRRLVDRAYFALAMLASALIAFAHFLAFFALATALILQLALVSESISVAIARRIQRADRAYGIAAILVLIFGILRVVYFEKGVDYYLSNTFFLLKMGLFIAVGLLSIYPTICYQRWNPVLKQDIVPELSMQAVRKLRKIMHTELVGIMGILLCASLMAKGFG